MLHFIIEPAVEKKYYKKRKLDLMQSLHSGEWSKELVINVVKSNDEVKLIKDHGVNILHLKKIIEEMRKGNTIIQSACGADFLDLIQMAK